MVSEKGLGWKDEGNSTGGEGRGVRGLGVLGKQLLGHMQTVWGGRDEGPSRVLRKECAPYGSESLRWQWGE